MTILPCDFPLFSPFLEAGSCVEQADLKLVNIAKDDLELLILLTSPFGRVRSIHHCALFYAVVLGSKPRPFTKYFINRTTHLASPRLAPLLLSIPLSYFVLSSSFLFLGLGMVPETLHAK